MTAIKWHPIHEIFIDQNTGNQCAAESPASLHTMPFTVVQEHMKATIAILPGMMTVTLVLPGIRTSDVAVTVVSRTLTVTGYRRMWADSDIGYEQVGSAPGSALAWSMVLPPDIDAGKARVNLDSGVLTISFPRKSKVQPEYVE